jgi:hypothetical protein
VGTPHFVTSVAIGKLEPGHRGEWAKECAFLRRQPAENPRSNHYWQRTGRAHGCSGAVVASSNTMTRIVPLTRIVQESGLLRRATPFGPLRVLGCPAGSTATGPPDDGSRQTAVRGIAAGFRIKRVVDTNHAPGVIPRLGHGRP